MSHFSWLIQHWVEVMLAIMFVGLAVVVSVFWRGLEDVDREQSE